MESTKKNPTPAKFKVLLNSGMVFFLIFSSCVTQRNIEYLQRESNDVQSFETTVPDEYKLKPNDELYIQISSIDDPSSNVFSNTGNQQGINLGTIQPYGASLSSYTVNKDGILLFPVIGSIAAEGKSVAEVSETIKKSLDNILNQPVVSVKLVNRYISVLGEVRSPGHFTFAQEKLSVFDALGFAGDITDYGNRNDITIIRNENGKNILIPVDLTNTKVLASEYYYLRPNDILYVKSLKKKLWSFQQVPYAIILSTITTGLFIYSVFK